MLGRGVKRKRSGSWEPEEEMVPAASTEEDGEDLLAQGRPDLSHLQQRQLVLSLCMEKLQRYQAGVELGLRRSVLLINTLRRIQEETRRDGAGTGAGGLDLSAQLLSAHPDVLVCTPDNVSDSLLDAPLCSVNSDSRLLRDTVREDLPVTCPGCTEGDKEVVSSPLSPAHPSPSVFPSHESSNSSPGHAKSPSSATHSAFSDAASTVGYLSDLALDDIFEDIDTSMYDTSDLPAPWATGSFWPVSVSFWGDEELKMCSTGHASPGTLQSRLMDLNDLDNIMEILVKS